MSSTNAIKVTLNDRDTILDVQPGEPLVHPLRQAGCAVRAGCRNGDCGACTVLMDGTPLKSCLVPSGRAEGRAVTTLDGLAANGSLHPVQAAFWDNNGFQCGFCIAGQVLCAVALLRANPRPDVAAVESALAGNLCRCTGYERIRTSVLKAAETMSNAADQQQEA